MSTEILNGVRNNYGPQMAEDKLPGYVKTEGYTKEMVVDFNYDDLPAYSADGSRALAIPADSYIVSARIHAKTAAAGGTSYTVGLTGSGGIIDADGLHTAAVAITASLGEDAWLAGTGALVGASIGGVDGQVAVVATGTFTAGSYRLIVEYIEPLS